MRPFRRQQTTRSRNTVVLHSAPSGSLVAGREDTMKRAVLTVITACGMAFGAALLGTVAHAQGNSDVQNGFDLAPVPLTLNGLNKSLVGKGSYIVNAQGACNDCHTNPP